MFRSCPKSGVTNRRERCPRLPCADRQTPFRFSPLPSLISRCYASVGTCRGLSLTSDSLAQCAPLRADRVPLGILFMLGATVMFAVSSALSKWQVAEYSVVEALFFRTIASLFTCAALLLPRTGLAVLHTTRHQCGGAILVDTRIVTRAAFRRRSLLLFHACLVGRARFCLLGRCADAGADCRIRGRGRLRFVPAVHEAKISERDEKSMS